MHYREAGVPGRIEATASAGGAKIVQLTKGQGCTEMDAIKKFN